MAGFESSNLNQDNKFNEKQNNNNKIHHILSKHDDENKIISHSTYQNLMHDHITSTNTDKIHNQKRRPRSIVSEKGKLLLLELNKHEHLISQQIVFHQRESKNKENVMNTLFRECKYEINRVFNSLILSLQKRNEHLLSILERYFNDKKIKSKEYLLKLKHIESQIQQTKLKYNLNLKQEKQQNERDQDLQQSDHDTNCQMIEQMLKNIEKINNINKSNLTDKSSIKQSHYYRSKVSFDNDTKNGK